MNIYKKTKNRELKILLVILAITTILISSILLFLGLEHFFKSEITPHIKLKGEEKVTLDIFSEYKDEGAEIMLGKDDAQPASVFYSNLDTSKPGKYEIVYRGANDYGKNAVEIKRVVNVVDSMPPVIALNSPEQIKIAQGQVFEDGGVTATDDCDGDITDKIEVSGEIDTNKAGEYAITYSVKDSSGNIAQVVKKIVVEPSQAPVYTEEDKVIYLTFDDGPSTQTTNQVLDVLAKYNIKATFFAVGFRVDQNPQMLQRAASEGHSIGLHSYTHNYAHIYSSEDIFMAEMAQLQARVAELTGISTNLMRFPGGTSNTVSRKYNAGIMTRLLEQTTAHGYLPFDWNIESGDSRRDNLPAQAIFDNLVAGLEAPTNRYIALMHDTDKNVELAQAVEQFIVYALENGYKFDKITPDTKAVVMRPNN